MAKDYNRSDRVADAIQRQLAVMIPKEIRDPRVGMVNINSVDVARDLSQAKVYVTLVGESDFDVCRQSVALLNKAASYLRGLLAKEMTMRSVPKMQFVFDESAIRGQQLSSLIDKAVAKDKANRNQDEE